MLADALADVTTWPVVLVANELGGWIHAGVQAADGQVVDIEGPHAPDAWLDLWAPFLDGETPVSEISIRPLTDVLGRERYREIEPPDPVVAALAQACAADLLDRLDLRPVAPVFTSVHLRARPTP